MQTEIETLKKRLYDDSKSRNFKFFAGANPDATFEDAAREINRFFQDAENRLPVRM